MSKLLTELMRGALRTPANVVDLNHYRTIHKSVAEKQTHPHYEVKKELTRVYESGMRVGFKVKADQESQDQKVEDKEGLARREAIREQSEVFYRFGNGGRM